MDNKYVCEDCKDEVMETLTCLTCGKEICFNCVYISKEQCEDCLTNEVQGNK
jgi:hypothetical protein